ncbi:hypothetical protein [Tenacibaculum sp. 190524A05c]|uniref:Uncharacterized protein n=1 Tax=Tenacibaculum platacis TaxID=3137852 RepID=A0ABM9NVN2_9FLAO
MSSKIDLTFLKQLFPKNGNFLKSIFIIALILLGSISFYKTTSFFTVQADEMNGYFQDKDSIIEKTVFAYQSDKKEIKQLKEQFEILSLLKKPHLVTAKKYASFNYSFSIFLTLFLTITAILGFIIVKIGWDNVTSFYLKTAFLISFFFSSIFGILPKVLGNQDNIKNNLTKYNFYNGLQLDVYSLINDNKGYLERNTTQSLDSLNLEILAITQNIKENQDLYFDVYIDRVPKEIKPF